MRYQLANGNLPRGSLLRSGPLSVYDTLIEPYFEWYMDWDEVLHHRSALEFVRERLTTEQREELTRVDAFWRSHPQAFNRFCKPFHQYKKPCEELKGWVVDEQGETPCIPHDHWWWWPLKEV